MALHEQLHTATDNACPQRHGSGVFETAEYPAVGWQRGGLLIQPKQAVSYRDSIIINMVDVCSSLGFGALPVPPSRF
jgi:hypothetical protein